MMGLCVILLLVALLGRYTRHYRAKLLAEAEAKAQVWFVSSCGVIDTCVCTCTVMMVVGGGTCVCEQVYANRSSSPTAPIE